MLVLADISLAATIGIAVAACVVGGVGGVVLIRMMTGGTIRAARRDAENMRQKATAEAEAAQRKIELEAERALAERGLPPPAAVPFTRTQPRM